MSFTFFGLNDHVLLAKSYYSLRERYTYFGLNDDVLLAKSYYSLRERYIYFGLNDHVLLAESYNSLRERYTYFGLNDHVLLGKSYCIAYVTGIFILVWMTMYYLGNRTIAYVKGTPFQWSFGSRLRIKLFGMQCHLKDKKAEHRRILYNF